MKTSPPVSGTFLSIALLLSVLSVSPSVCGGEKMATLKYANLFLSPSTNSIAAEQWRREVEKKWQKKAEQQLGGRDPQAPRHLVGL